MGMLYLCIFNLKNAGIYRLSIISKHVMIFTKIPVNNIVVVDIVPPLEYTNKLLYYSCQWVVTKTLHFIT